MTINYLFIDDENSQTPESYIDLLESQCRDLKIIRVKPCGNYDEEIQRVQENFESSKGSFGLILDLRLNQDANDQGITSNYRGSSLAQEIRTRMAEGALPRFPIALWSMDQFINESYRNDNTSHDLFDCVYVKDSEVRVAPNRVARELISLVTGYKSINEAKANKAVNNPITAILGVDEQDIENLDPRILDELGHTLDESVSDCARFVVSELIMTEGVLIDELVLAAKMGVDIKESNDSWQVLVKNLESTKYKGAFSDGWNRWWFSKVESWWFSITNNFASLKRTSAEDRVRFINEKLNLNLVEAQPIVNAYSRNYDTICQVYQKPLDSSDGVRANCPNLKPWQTPLYLSIQSVIERKHLPNWRVDPLDRYRIEAIKGE